MTAKPFHNRFNLSIAVLTTLLSGFLLSTSQPAYSGNNKPETHIVIDTLDIKTISPIEERLLDPEFDVRIPRGSRLQPWHDRNSMYPRRTLPISQLAVQNRKPVDLISGNHI